MSYYTLHHIGPNLPAALPTLTIRVVHLVDQSGHRHSTKKGGQ